MNEKIKNLEEPFSISLGENKDKVSKEDFELLKLIGKGSFGKVLQVRKKDNGQIYAMKVISKLGVFRKNRAKYIQAERDILVELFHPFIVKLHYAFQTESNLYLIMDFLNGGELFFHLESQFGHRFSEDTARFYSAELILAIQYLHSINITHRDLKPENILLDSEGHLALTDFGLAIRGINEMINGGDSHYSFCGTLSYMAPEMIQGIGHGKAVDWWSLGVLLYKMLTGELPFDSKHRKELFDMIINKPIEYPKILSKNAKKIISGLLCRDVKKRLGSGPTDAEEIKNHIFYKKIDWINLEKRKLKPPIELDKNKISVNYFDPKITRQEPIIKSVIMNSNENDIFSELQQHQNSFLGFTFPSSEIETNIKILN